MGCSSSGYIPAIDVNKKIRQHCAAVNFFQNNIKSWCFLQLYPAAKKPRTVSPIILVNVLSLPKKRQKL